MVAHALLAVIAAREHDLRPAPDGLIALTCNEIRRLFTTYVIESGRALACPLAWSLWRRPTSRCQSCRGGDGRTRSR
jgi:hypothetical protein